MLWKYKKQNEAGKNRLVFGQSLIVIALLFFQISAFRKSVAVIILGCFRPDSRKSLSPVSRISALAYIAALNMGRSFTSRIFDSEICSSEGVGTSSNVKRASDRNLSNADSF